ncbi:MAG: hypothetical protein ABR571_12020 [Jatrophihabitans sp.]|uniref:phage integrase central domain-containing protein n=1 Tax=Jatrophihabitans sp. TaxID=1932789 RepID=UPI00390E9FCD
MTPGVPLGRPPRPFGKILLVATGSGHVEARAPFRDFDGRVRLVCKTGSSRAAAERRLKAELAARQAPGGAGSITAATRVDGLADAWLDGAHEWSTGTHRTYASVVRKQLKPTLGQLRISEVTAGVVTRALRVIAETSGAGAAKSARACLSGNVLARH